MPEPKEVEPGVYSFDDAADMFTFIEKQAAAADAAMQDFQRVATYGDRYVSFDEASGLWLYGVIIKSPYQEDNAVEADLITHNRRLVRAWSLACLDGEIGTIHVASIVGYVTPRAWCHIETSKWQPPGSHPDLLCRHSPLRGFDAPWIDAVVAEAGTPAGEG